MHLWLPFANHSPQPSRPSSQPALLSSLFAWHFLGGTCQKKKNGSQASEKFSIEIVTLHLSQNRRSRKFLFSSPIQFVSMSMLDHFSHVPLGSHYGQLDSKVASLCPLSFTKTMVANATILSLIVTYPNQLVSYPDNNK